MHTPQQPYLLESRFESRVRFNKDDFVCVLRCAKNSIEAAVLWCVENSLETDVLMCV